MKVGIQVYKMSATELIELAQAAVDSKHVNRERGAG
jgi:hypothetical protein